MKSADCGDGVFIADFEFCDSPHDFDAVVHVWGPHQEGRGVCRHCSGSPRFRPIPHRDLIVRCAEGEPIPAETLAEFRDFVGTSGRVLIHCAAGRCRSATLALYTKMLRGRDLIGAISDVTVGVMTHYPNYAAQMPIFLEQPIRNIVAFHQGVA